MEEASLQGKRLIHVGWFASDYIRTSLNEAGIKVILIDYKDKADGAVWKYIQYDFNNHQLDKDHAEKIVKLVEELDPDGCMTSYDDCSPLTALVAEKLNLRGSSFDGCLNAKMKSQTMSVLCETDDTGNPKYPEAIKCASKSHLIASEKELNEITERLTYPIMVKLECGAGAVSARVAENEAELRDWYYKITTNFHDEADFPGMGLGYTNSVLVMEYHGGSEHDIDIVIYDGELLGAFVSDSCTNGTTHSFVETCGVLPSLLSKKRQEELIRSTYLCCMALGLKHGVYNVEMKLLPDGPKLIEINGRMGGSYRLRWIEKLYHINTALLSAQIACGIRPTMDDMNAKETAVSVMIAKGLNSVSQQQWRELQDLEGSGEVILFLRAEKPVFVDVVRPHASVAAVGKTYSEAKEKLLAICERFRITNENYDVHAFLHNLEEDVYEVEHADQF